MAEEKFCQGCHQKHRCQEVYEHLSKIGGTPVVFKAVVAFLLPIVVFISCLVAFEWLLAELTTSKGVQTVVGFLLALTVSGICILIVKTINRGLIKHK
ncbi:MAG: hypothetical protein ACYTDW_13815 [Planctomycetota bacterium]|jgi:hypothetical protein